MNPLKEYNIGFVGLPLGKSHFAIEVNDSFFACFEQSEITKGSLKLDLELEKQNNMLILDFSIKGFVELDCDRCLECYNQPLNINKKLIVKFGEAHSEQTDEIITIPSGNSHFDISHYVYEFTHLGLPMQHVHRQGDNEGEGCDPRIIEQLERFKKKSTKQGSENSPWSVLEKLDFKKDNK